MDRQGVGFGVSPLEGGTLGVVRMLEIRQNLVLLVLRVLVVTRGSNAVDTFVSENFASLSCVYCSYSGFCLLIYC